MRYHKREMFDIKYCLNRSGLVHDVSTDATFANLDWLHGGVASSLPSPRFNRKLPVKPAALKECWLSGRTV